MPIILLAAIVIAIAIAFILLRKKSVPSGWSAGPVINGTNYSTGTTVEPTGSFNFPTSSPGVHYVTKGTGPLQGTQITMRYQIDADPGVKFLSAKDDVDISIGPAVYFQRSGDDWSGTGKYEQYRWWATFDVPELTVGIHEVVVPFSGRWTAVETSNSLDHPTEFQAALSNAERVGFTWPGTTGYGHGVYATGKARFTLLEFAVS